LEDYDPTATASKIRVLRQPQDKKWPDDRYLSPTEAEEFLRDELGLPVKATTLAKYRCLGGGPRFELFGRFPKYTQPWLREWARSRIKGPKRSTSEPDRPS